LVVVAGGVRPDGAEAPAGAAERNDDRDGGDHNEQCSGARQSQQVRRGSATGHGAITDPAGQRPRSAAAAARLAAATPGERAQH